MNFNEIIKTNKQNVKNIIRLITKQDNEDLEQEVYLKIWKNSDKYEERGSFKSWINTIAKNVSKDYLKSAGFKNSTNTDSDDFLQENIKDKKDTPENSVLKIERQQRIIKAIDSLKPKLKETIMLCEIYGYTYEDAAKKLNCPIGTIKSRIYNAKKELAETLQDLVD
jgi:RNA polymerase sigma-70 factor (ECF subfamily)